MVEYFAIFRNFEPFPKYRKVRTDVIDTLQTFYRHSFINFNSCFYQNRWWKSL